MNKSSVAEELIKKSNEFLRILNLKYNHVQKMKEKVKERGKERENK